MDPDKFSELPKLGTFDVIVLKECLHEVLEHMPPFFTALKACMKNDKSLFIALTRPKNPPIPLPDLAMEQWRKMSPSREEIIEAADAVSLLNLLLILSNSTKIMLCQCQVMMTLTVIKDVIVLDTVYHVC